MGIRIAAVLLLLFAPFSFSTAPGVRLCGHGWTALRLEEPPEAEKIFLAAPGYKGNSKCYGIW